MTGLFALSMRAGSRILFAIALLDVIVSLGAYLAGVSQFAQYASGMDALQARAVIILTAVVSALHGAALPFFGALVIDRLDRWREAQA